MKTSSRTNASVLAPAFGALFALTASTASAHDPQFAAQAATPKPAEVRFAAAASLVAVRDESTGGWREPTPEEAEALLATGRVASSARAANGAAPRVYSTPGGGFGLTLGESTFGLVVAKRVNGKLVQACVPDAASASRFFSVEGPAHE